MEIGCPTSTRSLFFFFWIPSKSFRTISISFRMGWISLQWIGMVSLGFYTRSTKKKKMEWVPGRGRETERERGGRAFLQRDPKPNDPERNVVEETSINMATVARVHANQANLTNARRIPTRCVRKVPLSSEGRIAWGSLSVDRRVIRVDAGNKGQVGDMVLVDPFFCML